MVTTGFQSESNVQSAEPAARFETGHSFRDQTLATALASALLGFIIRKDLTENDIQSLNLHFQSPDRLMIVSDNKCIFPRSDDKGECRLCVIINGRQVNVCDLSGLHTELVDRIEDLWPSLLDAASKNNAAFDFNTAAILLNRASGRILAISKGLTALSGISETEFAGKEYNQIYRRLLPLLTDRKIKIENFTAGEIPLSIFSIGGSPLSLRDKLKNNNEPERSAFDTHRLIDEPDTIGLHFNRFNSLLQSGPHNVIAPESMSRLESIVAELISWRPAGDSVVEKTGIRLLVQSVLMAHCSMAGLNTRTEIDFDSRAPELKRINFKTPLVSPRLANKTDNEWLKTAADLARKVGLEITNLEITENLIANCICLPQKETATV